METSNISRRGLLGMLAAGIGAAIVAPGIIMPIKPKLVAPQLPALIIPDEVRRRYVLRGALINTNEIAQISRWIKPADLNDAMIGFKPGTVVVMEEGIVPSALADIMPTPKLGLDQYYESGRLANWDEWGKWS